MMLPLFVQVYLDFAGYQLESQDLGAYRADIQSQNA